MDRRGCRKTWVLFSVGVTVALATGTVMLFDVDAPREYVKALPAHSKPAPGGPKVEPDFRDRRTRPTRGADEIPRESIAAAERTALEAEQIIDSANELIASAGIALRASANVRARELRSRIKSLRRPYLRPR